MISQVLLRLLDSELEVQMYRLAEVEVVEVEYTRLTEHSIKINRCSNTVLNRSLHNSHTNKMAMAVVGTNKGILAQRRKIDELLLSLNGKRRSRKKT